MACKSQRLTTERKREALGWLWDSPGIEARSLVTSATTLLKTIQPHLHSLLPSESAAFALSFSVELIAAVFSQRAIRFRMGLNRKSDLLRDPQLCPYRSGKPRCLGLVAESLCFSRLESAILLDGAQ